jgi:predicted HicB family RNase H-like nuclease
MDNNRIRHRVVKLLTRFIFKEVPPTRFVPAFMKLWRENRDSQSEIKRTWKEPFDQELQAAFLRKEISSEDFTDRWMKLWGICSESDREFLEMIDRVFTACDVFREEPESKYELNENQLRAFVAEALSSFLHIVAKQEELSLNS